MTNRLTALIAFLLFAVAAGGAQAATASYQCGGGTMLTANFSPASAESGRVVLSFAGQGRVTLPQKKSADGGRYANGRIEFWIKGNSATLTREGRSEACHTR